MMMYEQPTVSRYSDARGRTYGVLPRSSKGSDLVREWFHIATRDRVVRGCGHNYAAIFEREIMADYNGNVSHITVGGTGAEW